MASRTNTATLMTSPTAACSNSILALPARPADPSRPSEVDPVADDRAGHAVATAPAAAELGPDDRDDLHARLAEQGVGQGVAVVGEDHARIQGDGAAVAGPEGEGVDAV